MGINHTPGPWIVYGAPGNVWAPFDQKNVANAYIADRDRETQSANARLIAAAPAMLAALRETLRDLDAVTGIDDHGSDTIGCIENRVRAILSRIDGAPTAQPAGAIGEAGAGVRDLLFDVRDFLAGFEDCEDNGELVRGLQERIARATEGRADRPKSEPVADFAAHAAAIEAAQGYVSHPAQWNAPTPAQVAHLLALSGIAHGPVSASDGGDCDGGDD